MSMAGIDENEKKRRRNNATDLGQISRACEPTGDLSTPLLRFPLFPGRTQKRIIRTRIPGGMADGTGQDGRPDPWLIYDNILSRTVDIAIYTIRYDIRYGHWCAKILGNRSFGHHYWVLMSLVNTQFAHRSLFVFFSYRPPVKHIHLASFYTYSIHTNTSTIYS